MKNLNEAAKNLLAIPLLIKESEKINFPGKLEDYLKEFAGLGSSPPSFKFDRSIRGYEIYKSSDIKVPSLLVTLFKTLWIECSVRADGGYVKTEGDSFTFSFNWCYEHPGGGTNGLDIGSVFVDKESGKVVHVRKGR